MTTRTVSAHAPALTLQEAAMLPALQQMPAKTCVPKNLLVPTAHLTFRPVEAPMDEAPMPAARRGSPAGRAVLRAAGVTLPGAAERFRRR